MTKKNPNYFKNLKTAAERISRKSEIDAADREILDLYRKEHYRRETTRLLVKRHEALKATLPFIYGNKE